MFNGNPSGDAKFAMEKKHSGLGLNPLIIVLTTNRDCDGATIME